MEYSSRLSFGVEPPAAPHKSMQPLTDKWHVPASVQRDLNVARTSRANLLLVGTERLVAGLVSFLVPDVDQAVMIRCGNGQLLLPPASLRTRTVVLLDVDALTPEEQQRLCDWLDSGSDRTQVVSTASAPFSTLVETGAFNDALYYRLNTVYIDLSN